MENPIKTDDLGVPPILETPKYQTLGVLVFVAFSFNGRLGCSFKALP